MLKRVITFLMLSTASAALAAAPPRGQVKNIIVMIADGSGYSVQDATRFWTGNPLTVDGSGWTKLAMSTYPLRTGTTPIPGAAGLAQDPNTVYSSAKAWDTTPVAGNSAINPTYPAGFQGYEWNRATAPDSGNTASAISSGLKTYNNAINVDGNGSPVYTLAEFQKSLGRSTGVVTTVQFGDATPAALGGAHNVSRANRQAIANEMFSAGVLDVIGGTGNPDFDDNGQARAPNYSWITPELWTDLKNSTNVSGFNGQGWTLAQSKAAIEAYAAAGVGTLPTKLAMIAQADNGTQEYRTDAPGTDPLTYEPGQTPFLITTPSQSSLTLAALNALGGNAKGFYLMSEGGAVDRAEHSNNLGRAIEEQISFDQTVQSVVDWVDRGDTLADWSNTLLVVTADHDHNLYGPDGATVPFQDLINEGAGNLPGYRWFGNGHGNQVVPLYAYGSGASGLLDLVAGVDSFTDAQGRTFGRGAYTDQALLGRYLQQIAAVPEPASWALMIAGFLLTGSAMRRRERQVTYS